MKDTIVAISTLVGNSAINIIRISGKNSIKIVSEIFKGKDLTKVNSNTINYGKIVYKNEIIDEVLVSVFKEGKSFTKEQMVEINTHGGVTSVNKILEILLEKDIRLAEPGEFIKRAFLNGRIDLIEAESVSDLIMSKTESARKLSMRGINKDTSKLIKDLREKILEIIANIEVNIDYPEYEDAIEITNKILKTKFEQIKKDIEQILSNSNKNKIIKNGIMVAIVGKPNVGKSSILNKLIGSDKAIVTDIEGTTRDIVEGDIVLKGVNIRLIDTAGIRDTKNKIENIGVNKTLEVIKEADLILFVVSNSEPFSEEDRKIYETIKNKKKIVVINKSDLKSKINYNFDEKECLLVNTIDKEGLKKLEQRIEKMFELDEIEMGDFTYLSNDRQINLIKNSLEITKEILQSIDKNVLIDLIVIDIKRLWDKLGEITGETYKEELLDEIFSKFCLGK